MLLQVQDGANGLTLRQGWNRMASEGQWSPQNVTCSAPDYSGLCVTMDVMSCTFGLLTSK